MEIAEKEALNKLKNDMKVNVLITSNMLRKLETQGMITKTEREMLAKLVDGSVRNPKVIEILKRKGGGFKALTEVMKSESTVNKHYVEKLNQFVREHHADRRPIRPKVDPEAHKKLQEKLELSMKLLRNVTTLVLGENHESSIESSVDNLKEQLEKCRSFLDEDHIYDDVSLHCLQEKYMDSIKEAMMSKEYQHQKERENLKEKNAKLYNKCTVLQQEIDMMKKYQDDIIHDTVEQQVKTRLMRHGIYDQFSTKDFLTPRSQGRTDGLKDLDGSPRGNINIANIDNCHIHVNEESYHVEMRNVEKDYDSDRSY